MRYFIAISYFGKSYYGWQIQPNQISIQEVLEEKLSIILREKIQIVGAGRTDTGVNAIKTFAHFDYEANLPDQFLSKINNFLPKDIAINKIFRVIESAHARFDATKRSYIYKITHAKNVFSYNYSWQINFPLDLDAMNLAAKHLIFNGDFSSFAKVHTDVKTHICDVTFAKWEKTEDGYVFNITADRFLRNMVRAIVGTLVEVGRKKISVEEFNEIIAKKDRSFAKSSAPPQGLYLSDVQYPKELFIK